VSTDGGVLLLREVDRKIDLLGGLGACFSDGRSPLRVKHSLSEMLSQRIYGLALGYQDLNDHEQLRSDPLLAVLSGKRDRKGTDGTMPRVNERCDGCMSHKPNFSASCTLMFNPGRELLLDRYVTYRLQ
jgi:hypothetical protein